MAPPTGRISPAAGLAVVVAVSMTVAMLSVAPAGLAQSNNQGPSAPIDPSAFGGLEARSIGPAVMGGRIAGLDAVREETLVIYVGAASGGVWKSDDGGLSFDPVFDDHIQSIGAVEIDPADSKTVWVGTGEAWTRNSVSVGDGVYRSQDGGESWQHRGLADSERITRILVDPTSSDTVYVCATGHLWNANQERGVYKTTDGGESWSQILAVDENTGCSDLDMDPQDPKILYAGMWQFRRYPWSFTSGGPGSGLYRTRDGGESWTELTQGLPEGDKGRIAVGVAPSRPNRVYALVEAEDTALYRSDDVGTTWEEVNSSSAVSLRPFYFANVFVDPTDHQRVYKPGLQLAISTDGGETFGGGGSMHADLHALWINPEDPYEILVGTDGGLYHSYDRGYSLRHAQSLPISQYYEVAADNDWPYNVYGGLQDNGTWMGPSRAPGGIMNAAWRNIGFGDGFHAYPDPGDPDIVFVEYQGGELMRIRKSTGEIKEIKPYPGSDDPDYRCNWNTAMHLPARGGTLYAGCQFLFKTSDLGESWTRISPDLTTNDPEKQLQHESGGLSIDNSTAENHTTIYTISESPKNPRVVWVGTDDGNLQLSRDGGENWTQVAGKLPGVPAQTWVAHVEASPHDEATVFVALDGHRLGDMTTYLYRSDDFGDSWTSLVTSESSEPPEPNQEEAPSDEAPSEEAPPRQSESSESRPASPLVRHAGQRPDTVEGFAHVILQDPVSPDLLFAGTELGLFLSIDGGAAWTRFEGNFPPAPVHDLDIHPTQHDLVIGTHGRGIYILDDLTPLRAMTRETLEQKLEILPSRPAVQMLRAQIQSFPGADEFIGETLPEVARLYYYQERRHIFGNMTLEIFDREGQRVATVPAGKRKGLNRVDWPMYRKPPKLPPASTLARAMTGPRVPEGAYKYKITKGKDVYEGNLELVADPRSSHSKEDRAIQQTLANRLYDVLEDLTYTVEALVDLRDQAKQRAEAASGRTARRLTELADALEALRTELVSTSEAGMLSGDEQLREKLGNLFGAIAGYDGRPTDSQIERAEVLAGQFQRAQQRFESMVSEEELSEINRALDPSLELLTREAWQKQQDLGGSGESVSLDAAEAFLQSGLFLRSLH